MKAREFLPAPIYYFAYGMLTDPDNVPGGKLVGKAILPNFQFEMFKYANVIPSAGSKVFGTLWQLDRKMLHQLDQIEDYPLLYDRKTVPVIYNGKKFEVELYTMTAATRAAAIGTNPNQTYLEYLIKGYKSAGIPVQQLTTSLL